MRRYPLQELHRMFWFFLFSLAALALGYFYGMYRLLRKVKKSKRLAFLKIQVVFSLVLGLVLVTIAYAKRDFLRRLIPAQSEIEEVVPSRRTGGSTNACPCTWDSMRLKRDDYATRHRPSAERLASAAFIENEAVMNGLLSKGKLIPFKSKDGMYIRKLTHSEPFLLPEAAKVFEELRERFTARLRESESDAVFVVSSVTRTAGQQEEIRKRYPHGATPGSSTHSYGASIDILKVETVGNCYNARKALELTLREMQEEKKLLICPESKCIHLTAL